MWMVEEYYNLLTMAITWLSLEKGYQVVWCHLVEWANATLNPQQWLLLKLELTARWSQSWQCRSSPLWTWQSWPLNLPRSAFGAICQTCESLGQIFNPHKSPLGWVCMSLLRNFALFVVSNGSTLVETVLHSLMAKERSKIHMWQTYGEV